MQSGQKVGGILLEESEKRSLLGLCAIHMNKNVVIDRTMATDEEILTAFDELFGGDEKNLYLYSHWGRKDVDLICHALPIWQRLFHLILLC